MTIFKIRVDEEGRFENRIFPSCHPSQIMAKMTEWFREKTAAGGYVYATTDHDLEFTAIRLLVKRGVVDHRSITFLYHKANGEINLIGLGSDGGLTDWPLNFFDRYANMSLELL